MGGSEARVRIGRLRATFGEEEKMRHFLLVSGTVLGNFILWAFISFLPIHSLIIFFIAIAVGCLMIAILVHFGKRPDRAASAEKG